MGTDTCTGNLSSQTLSASLKNRRKWLNECVKGHGKPFLLAWWINSYFSNLWFVLYRYVRLKFNPLNMFELHLQLIELWNLNLKLKNKSSSAKWVKCFCFKHHLLSRTMTDVGYLLRWGTTSCDVKQKKSGGKKNVTLCLLKAGWSIQTSEAT